MAADEVDILAIHSEIMESFNSERENLDTYTERYKTLEEILNLSQLSDRARIKVNKAKDDIHKKIDDIQLGKTSGFYVMETATIISKYTGELRKPKIVSFMGIAEEKSTVCYELIKKYLQIVAKYDESKVPSISCEIIDNACKSCGKGAASSLDLDGFSVCVDCGKEVAAGASSSSYKDAERVNVGSKYTYDKRVHFRDCLNQFQGRQNATIPKKVYDALEVQFDLHGLLVKTDNKLEKFSKITKQHILLFLKETGYNKHYEDAVLIHYSLTGNKPPDLTHMEASILADFDSLVDTYEVLFKNENENENEDKKRGRKNFINNQYVLYQLLRRHKYSCDVQDFNLLKTVERKSYHDEICKQLFEKLGWNFISVF